MNLPLSLILLEAEIKYVLSKKLKFPKFYKQNGKEAHFFSNVHYLKAQLMLVNNKQMHFLKQR